MMCCIIVTSLFHVTDQSPSTMKVVLGVTTVVLLAVCGSVYGSISLISTSPAPSPTPSHTAFPTPSFTPSHTAIPTSSPTRTPSPTPSPTWTPSSTASPSPTPSPSPEPPVYSYNDTSGNQVFRLKGFIDVNVTFGDRVIPFKVPRNVSEVQIIFNYVNTSGTNDGSMSANLTWNDTGPCDGVCDFTLAFNMSAVFTRGSQSWQVDHVDFKFNAEAYNITPSQDLCLVHKEALYKTQLHRAYQCSLVDITLTAPNVSLTNASALVHIVKFELQAFSFTHNSAFDASPLVCGRDMPDNKIVPIAVGAALALLVIIVVIAYIIGRFRNRGKKSDYEVISS